MSSIWLIALMMMGNEADGPTQQRDPRGKRQDPRGEKREKNTTNESSLPVLRVGGSQLSGDERFWDAPHKR